MSLINQMLQDLDKRGSDAIASEPMYAQIRAVDLPSSRRAWWLILLPLTLLGAVLAWLLWARFLPNLSARQSSAELVTAHAAARIVAPAVPGAVPRTIIAAPVQELNAPAENNLPPIAELPLLLKLSSGLDKTMIVELPALDANRAPVVIAKVEKITPESGEKSEKNKISAPAALLKPAEQSSIASKFVKEMSVQQQAESEYRQATVLQQQGRAVEAILMLEQALKSDAQHAAARQSLIALLLETKRHDEAMRLLQQSLSVDKNQPGMAMILARLQVEKGLVPGAIDTLQKTLPHAQDRADFLAFLAALQQREAHHKEAAELYQQALKKIPQNGVWWMGLGISLQADGRRQEALDAFTRAKSGNGLSPDLLAFVEQKIIQLQR